MVTSRYQVIVNDYRARLLARERQATEQLERYYQHVVATYVQPALNKLYDEMVDALASGEKIPLTWLYEAQRLENIKKIIDAQIGNFGQMSFMTARQLQQAGIAMGQMAAQALLDATVPPGISWAFGLPSPAAIANLVGATQTGSPLADLFAGFGREAADLVGKSLVTGITLGWNPRKVAPLVQQALGESRNRALTISRDTLNRAYRSASLETYRANSDVVTKYRRTCAKSARSCAACIDLDGTLYDLDEEFAVHPCDRCAAVPVTRDWADILGPLGIDTSTIPDTRPKIQSGSEWFAQQDEATQRSVLGSDAAYKLYKAGTPLSAFVQHTQSDDWGKGIQVKSVKQVAKEPVKAGR